MLAIKHSRYVEAARSLGCPNHRILAQHVLPNSFAPVGVQVTLDIGAALLTTATLGSLGWARSRPPPSGARCWRWGGNFFWMPGG
ncbi:MAG: ABC transporter permease subunit [Thermomicrobiales bacterium]